MCVLLDVIQLCVGCSGQSCVTLAVSGLWCRCGCPCCHVVFNRWVASFLYYRCDVSCSIRCIVETMLCGVPSVVAVVTGFYCRRVGYSVLVVGDVSWGLCHVLHRAFPHSEHPHTRQQLIHKVLSYSYICYAYTKP